MCSQTLIHRYLNQGSLTKAPPRQANVLRHYLLQSRKHYVTEYIQFRKDLVAWKALQETNRAIQVVAESLLDGAAEGAAALPPSFLRILNAPRPAPPCLCMCMPTWMMARVLQLAAHKVPIESGEYPRFTTAVFSNTHQPLAAADSTEAHMRTADQQLRSHQ